MALSIILVNWNTAELLVRCLRTVRSCAVGRDAQIVVVDNASKDDSVARVRAGFPDVSVIQNAENVGFGRANNQGAQACTGNLLLLLNTDTEVRPGALGAMVEFMGAEPGVGILGPRLVGADGRPQTSCRTEPGLRNALLEAMGLCRLLPSSRVFGRPEMSWFGHDERIDVDYLSGACLLIRRELWDELGGFDEGFFFYGEDADLCRRARDAGHRVAFFPGAEVLHLGGASTTGIRPQAAVEGYRAVLLYLRKHRGWAAATLARLIYVAGTTVRLVAAAIAFPPAALIGRGKGMLGRLRTYASAWRVLALGPMRRDRKAKTW